MSEVIKKIKKKYEEGYRDRGLSYQRRFPNEELCRFFGRNFFALKKKDRKKIKILETGCGTSGNLKMISEEGFSAFGIDISKEAIDLSKNLFFKKKLKGNFQIGDFTLMPYKNNFFNCIVDLFSSCSLDRKNGEIFIKEIGRILKKNGKFFTYFPSKKSDMFHLKSNKVYDIDTIESFKKSAFPNHPLRFMSIKEYCDLLKKNSFKIDYKEEIMRTYFSGKEKFYFLIIEASKK